MLVFGVLERCLLRICCELLRVYRGDEQTGDSAAMHETNQPNVAEIVRLSPVGWFFELERGLRTEDYELAHRANQELHDLGVQVRFRGDRWRAPVSICSDA